MNERVAAANAALNAARALGVFEAAGQQPVMGPSVLTGAQMAGWIRSQGYSPNIQTSIDDLANTYIQEGNDENVRGDVAFAQAVVETGGFEAAPDNNYAGMGWCDSCSSGTSFPTPAGRGAGPDPAPPELRRPELPGVAAAPPAVAVLVRDGPGDRGEQLRHVLREGLGADLGADGARQLGDRPELLREGAAHLRRDARLRPERRLSHPASRRRRPGCARPPVRRALGRGPRGRSPYHPGARAARRGSTMAMLGLRFDLRVPDFADTTHARQYAAALDMAAWADRIGLDWVIVSEHHGAPDGYLPAPLIFAAAVLGRTSRIGVNVAAVLVPLHDPVRLAEQLAVLDLCAPGRISVVAGLGYRSVEFDDGGRRSHPSRASCSRRRSTSCATHGPGSPSRTRAARSS